MSLILDKPCTVGRMAQNTCCDSPALTPAMPSSRDVIAVAPIENLLTALKADKPDWEEQCEFVTGPLEFMKESLYQLWLLLPPDDRSEDIELMLHVATSVRISVENCWEEVRMGLGTKSSQPATATASCLPPDLMNHLNRIVAFMESDVVMQQGGALVMKCCAHVGQILAQ